MYILLPIVLLDSSASKKDTYKKIFIDMLFEIQ